MMVQKSSSTLPQTAGLIFVNWSATWHNTTEPGLKCARSGFAMKQKWSEASAFADANSAVQLTCVALPKAQGLALNPNKISGQCGRLLCCLAYEYETYNEMRKTLPKCGKKVQLESGQAEVLSLDVLAQKMTVCCSNGERIKVHVDELTTGQDIATPDKPQPARLKSDGQKKESGVKKHDDAKPEKSERRRRPTNRNRRPKSSQQKTEGAETRTTSTEKPQQQQAQKPVKKQDQEQPQGDSQNRRRRNRRRPKRRPSKPQDSDNKS